MACTQIYGVIALIMINVDRPNLPEAEPFPWQVVLGCIRKQTEQAMKQKPVSNIPPWSLLQFLRPGSTHEFLFWLL